MPSNEAIQSRWKKEALGGLVATGSHNDGSGISRLSQRVYNHVVANIINGNFKPSMKLVERELAEQTGMSHVPVREAMEKLEQHGWINRIPRRGAFVMEFDAEKLESTYQVREVIEAGAAYIVAQQITSEQLGVDESQITPEAKFVDDLGADSLDTVELVMALEEEFDLEISDEEAEKLTTVSKVVSYIEDCLDKK